MTLTPVTELKVLPKRSSSNRAADALNPPAVPPANIRKPPSEIVVIKLKVGDESTFVGKIPRVDVKRKPVLDSARVVELELTDHEKGGVDGRPRS